MNTRRMTAAGAAAVLCATLLSTVGRATPPAPSLIAIGTVSSFYEDFAAATAAPLENGAPGNRLGGSGSGIAYLGGSYFVALPDRGPNAIAFNPCTDDTVSYINRFHTFHLSLAPSDPVATTLPFTVTPMLVDTTLLWSHSPLVYGGPCGLVGDGAPALNGEHIQYFTGRSDGFDGAQTSADPSSGRLDPEGIRVSNDRHHVYISDESGPYVYEFDRLRGRRTRVFTLPGKFAIAHQNAIGALEISGNTSGRVTNKGMEGLAITPDGNTLVGAMQSPLAQDGGDVKGGVTRIVAIDIKTGKTREYTYHLDTGVKTTISEIVAINNHDFIVDERDSKGLGDTPDASPAAFKKLYRISLTNAYDVSNVTDHDVLLSKAVAKEPFLDLVAALVGAGFSPYDIPAKIEGVAFGQDVMMGGSLAHTLVIANDNDFSPIVTNSHTGNTSNPNRFFIFAFTDTDLPGFVPQQFKNDDES